MEEQSHVGPYKHRYNLAILVFIKNPFMKMFPPSSYSKATYIFRDISMLTVPVAEFYIVSIFVPVILKTYSPLMPMTAF